MSGTVSITPPGVPVRPATAIVIAILLLIIAVAGIVQLVAILSV